MTPSYQGKTSTASLPVKVRSKPRVLRSSGTEHPNQVFVNVYNNSGTIVVGDNNEVTVRTSASSTTGIYSISNNGLRSNFMSAGFTPGQNGVAKSQNTDLSQNSSARRSAIGAQITKMTSFYPVVKHEHSFGCGRGKRKGCHGGESRRKGRKRFKNQQPDSRLSTPSSDVDLGLSPASIELPLDSNSASFQQGLHSFHRLCTYLHPPRDNGRWSEFDVRAQQLLDQAGISLTDQIIIDLEKSVALCYQKKLDESEDLINDAEKRFPQTSGSIRRLLEMLSNCYRAGLYRRRKRFGQKRQQWLHAAETLAYGFPPCLPVGILLYEEGTCKRDVASILTGPSKDAVIGEAKELMQRCIDLCCRLDHQEDVYVRKQHVAVSKMAIMNLHCETSVSRSRKIGSSNVVEAGKLLDTLQSDYYRQTEVQGSKIQRLIANVDLFYRIEKFSEAEKVAQEALEIAKRLEFNLDVMPLEERLTDIRRNITESSSSETYREIPRIIDSCSGSSLNNTPYSSEFEDKEQF